MTQGRAAPDHGLVTGFVTDVIQRYRELSREIEYLESLKYRSNVPRDFLRLLARITEAALSYLLNLVREDSETSQPQTLARLRVWDSIGRESASQLRYVHGGAASRVPGSLSRALDDLVARLGFDSRILLREKWKYNYTVIPFSLTELYRKKLSGPLGEDELNVLFEGIPSFHCIAFPAIERNNFLLHAALGHEIGHLITNKWYEDSQILEDQTARNNALAYARRAVERERLATDRGDTQETLFDARQRAAIADRVMKVRKRFLDELCSDIVGVRLFGPSLVLAMTNIALASQLDRQPRAELYYPPWCVRLAVGLEILRSTIGEGGGAWLPLVRSESHREPRKLSVQTEQEQQRKSALLSRVHAAVAEHMRHVEAIASRDLAYSDGVVGCGAAMALDSIDAFDGYFQERYGSCLPDPTEATREADTLVIRLESFLPPNDIGRNPLKPEPPSIAALWNAGWFYYIDDQARAENAAEDVRAENIDRMNRLLLKALDDLVLMRDYAKWIDESRDE